MGEVIFEELDATPLESSEINYKTEFLNLMCKIYSCYLLLIKDGVKVPKNNENAIRDILLLDYITKRNIRNVECGIYGFNFDKEVDVANGRVDIKILPQKYDFEEFDAYFTIECKRLDGKKTLNAAYVEDGIKRFTTQYKSSTAEYYYPSYYGINGMIGFVVQSINIDENMKAIDKKFYLIKKDVLYGSNHCNVELLHMMMDFSQ
ncbi:hypothetical protein [Sulfurospirillum sp.]|uniref:hypothetical protein n=1 Tax=Sulfurospirillum sp. TaxID=2053622 RepID=UPI002FDE3B88